MKKQTAVDWFIETTTKLGYVSADIAKQAKQMEREQITTFAKLWESKIFDGTIDSVDDLYNEMMGGNK